MSADLFCVPNTWFGDFAIGDMPTVQVALDGSYGAGPDRMLAYGGWFGFEDAWKCLAPAWSRMLVHHNIHHFRSNDLVVRHDWAQVREDFGRVALKAGLHAVVSVPTTALMRKCSKESVRKRMVFQNVVRQLFEKAPDDVEFAFICDREEDLADEIGPWVKSLKRPDDMAGRPSVYERISGICFMNSRRMLQVQAADLVAHLARERAEFLRDNPLATPDRLVDLLIPGFTASYVSPDEFSSDQ